MRIMNRFPLFSGPWRSIAAALLVAMVGVFLYAPACIAVADQPEDDGGCSCHSAETETWQQSPHAQQTPDGTPVATCETCHGVYLPDHPEEGMIQLETDSSICRSCHQTTYAQWEGSVHAEAGTQCIGCHVAHSQNLRLSDQTLCRSCHRDALTDPLHTAHWLADAPCTSCHLAGSPIEPGAIASTDPAMALLAAPSHDFVHISSVKCLECHSQEVTEASHRPADGDYTTRLALINAAEQIPVLEEELYSAMQLQRTLSILNPMSLGFGISIGGLAGIIFMLVIAHKGRKEDES